jgi:hypothetical protein
MVNKAVIPIHPVVPNPSILLSQIPPDTAWLTVLDLKDAFFYLPILSGSQYLFAFEDPKTQLKQGIWTVLSLGFRDSTHFLDKL